MKRLLKSWVFWGFAVAGPFLGLALLIRQGLMSEFCCCGSHRTVRSVGWGLDSANLRLASWEEDLQASPAYLDFLAGAHEHRWTSLAGWSARWWGGRQTEPGDFLLAGRMTAYPNLLFAYNGDSRFREFVQGKVRRGEATREQLAEVLQLPDEARPDDPRVGAVAVRRDAWVAEYGTPK